MSYAFGAAIHIAYRDLDGGDEGGRYDVRSAVKSGGYCVAKITPPNKAFAFALRVFQHPFRQAKQIWLNKSTRGPLDARFLELLYKQIGFVEYQI